MVSLTLKAAEFSNCHGCESSISFETAAESATLAVNIPKTDVYVFNMASAQIKAYNVDVEIMPDGRAYATTIEKSVDNHTLQRFNTLATAYDNVATETRNGKFVPSHIAPSAYRLVNSSHTVNNVIDYYNNSQSFRTKTANYVAAAFALTGKLVEINLTITVHFSDGSEAVFNLTGIGPNGELGLELTSAIDADNNTIPLTREGYESGGEYSFIQGGPNAIEEFLNAAARLGVPIVSGSDGGSFKQTMTCDSEGKCTITVSPR